MVSVTRNVPNGLGTETHIELHPPISYRRSLLFIAPPGNLSDSLLAAVEREFTWLSVVWATDVEHARESSNGGTELILVDHQFLEDFVTYRYELTRNCPSASTAILAGFRTPIPALLTQIIESHAICGVLPMDVNLDVWLSILRILLKGGEYFPPRLLQRQETVEPAVRSKVLAASSGVRDETGSGMHSLTEREIQILERVARGNQNKIIAADLGLSEHTVKIHLHNIIRKLGVHNRTEAAAIYHDQMKQKQAEKGKDDSAADLDRPARSEARGGGRA